MAAVVSVAAVLAVQLLLFPIPFGVWLQGAVLGLLGSLMAVGLGLTYRLNKVINFAQGDLGTAPAVLAVGLIAFSGVNYFLGLATGLVASLLLTATVEILVVRRFRRSPRLILTVATIGLSQLLVVLSLLIPRIWGQTPIATAVVTFPWHLAWHVGPVVFDANDLVAVIVSVACLAAVSLWFTRSDVGIAVQAVGDRRDRASMLGIPVGRLQSVTWVVAGVLSFVSIFFQATILGLPLDPTYGLTALVTALAALALGNFSELPVIAASAVALGILEQGVAWDDPTNPALGLAVLAGVVFAAIVVRQLLADAAPTARSSRRWRWPAACATCRRRCATSPRCGSGRRCGALVAFAAAATLPLWMGPGELIRGSALVVLAIVGCSVVVLTGWSGQVSLGQMSFAAVGATVGAVALLDWHWDLSLALLLAGAAAAARGRRGGHPHPAPRRDVRRRHHAGLRPGRLGLPARPGGILLDPPEPARRPLPVRRSRSPRRRRCSRSAWASWCSCCSPCTACATAAPGASCARCRPTSGPRRATACGSCGPSSPRSPSPASSPAWPAASCWW